MYIKYMIEDIKIIGNYVHQIHDRGHKNDCV